MLYNMKLTFNQIFDIKCILSGKNKKEIADVMNLHPAQFSREVKSREVKEMITSYFDKLDPDINIICNKLQKEYGDDLDSVNESPIRYHAVNSEERLLAEKDQRIADLKDNLKDKNEMIDLLKMQMGLSKQTG